MSILTPPKLARASAIVGAVAWAIILFVRTSTSYETELIDKILLLGVLIIVPLALYLVAMPDESGRHVLPYRLAVIAQPFGAAAAVASFFMPQGRPAALLAALWLIVTALIALFGFWRLLFRGVLTANELCIGAGLIYLPVGGMWFFMSRFGIQPLGFGDTIVLLTAVHFHFAGFAAPILAGLAGRTLDDRGRATQLFQLAAAGIIAGTPIIATGITLSPLVAFIGAIVISLGLILLAIVVLGWVIRSVGSLPAQFLLGVSAISSLSAMVLACLYAYSLVTKTVIIDIPHMAMTHGVINAFGFALCGLVAWSLAPPDLRGSR
jgi:YndJ-like protein